MSKDSKDVIHTNTGQGGLFGGSRKAEVVLSDGTRATATAYTDSQAIAHATQKAQEKSSRK